MWELLSKISKEGFVSFWQKKKWRFVFSGQRRKTCYNFSGTDLPRLSKKQSVWPEIKQKCFFQNRLDKNLFKCWWKNVWKSWQWVFDWIIKTTFYVSTESIEGQFFWKEIWFQRIFLPDWEGFDNIVQTTFYVSSGLLWQCFQKLFSTGVSEWEQLVSNFWQNAWGSVVKNAFDLSMGFFRSFLI